MALVTYLFLYQQPISRFIVQAPGLLADASFNRLSQMAIRWLIIAKSTWHATPYLLIFLSWLGLNAAIAVAFWKIIESHIVLEAKVGITLAVLSAYFILGIAVPFLRRGRQQGGSSVIAPLIGSSVVGLLLLGGMGLGIWKLLDSQMQTGGKTVACFALLYYTTLMSLVPTLLLRRKRPAKPTVTPDNCSI